MDRFPLPGMGQSAVAAAAPAPGPGNWSGAPSASLDGEGGFVIAYRVRLAGERGSTVVLARSDDGERLSVIATLSRARFGAESLERPALIRTEYGALAPVRLLRHAWPQALADRAARGIRPAGACERRRASSFLVTNGPASRTR